jgi:sigma-B regulation protein RsbU (phosphoserine phosphatase)
LRFLAAVFFASSTLGFLIDIKDLGAHPAAGLMVEVLGWGLVGAGYAFSAIRSRQLLPLVIAAHVLLTWLPDRFAARDVASSSLADTLRDREVRLRIDAAGAGAGVALAYVCFMVFIRREGSRYLRDHTEMALAKALHRDLVPPIKSRDALFEFYGASVPSGEVGGDLLDLVRDGRNWIAYVADVSGHGVSAGVVMGMFKSAARMRLRFAAGIDALLTDLNRVMFGLKSSNMFVTCACVRHRDSGHIEFGLAGHPPILHFKFSSKTVDELSVGHVPLGIFEDSEFPCGEARIESGDVLVLLTDGLTEVFSGDGEELGLERLKEVVIEHSGSPLGDLFDAVMTRVRAHGPQVDDQTLLLVRCGGRVDGGTGLLPLHSAFAGEGSAG